MSNREQRIENKSLHLYLAFARTKDGMHPGCVRTIDKGNGNELEFLKAKLKIMGGTWRIHRTVNSRDVEKARIWLMKDLLDHPEHASYIDSQWRTALLQPICNVDKRFMLDIDTQNEEEIGKILSLVSEDDIINTIKSPHGWHYICKPFDTRKVCELPYVTLLRDGYFYVTTVKGENNETD